MSPRNTAEAVYHLMKSTNSHRIVAHDAPRALLANTVALAEKDSYRIDIIQCPTLPEIYPALVKPGVAPPTITPYPARSRPHAPDDIVYYLHSSGSTGLPKPIPQTERRSLEWIFASTSRRNVFARRSSFYILQ